MNPTEENPIQTTSGSSNNNNNLDNPSIINYVDDDDDEKPGTTTTTNEQQSFICDGGNNADDEEFLIHLQFDEDSHPLLRYNVDDCKIMGIHNEKLLIRIGDSFFFGNIDPNQQQQQTSILFAYEPQHKFIQEIHKSFTKIQMKRVLLKPKTTNENQQQQQQSLSNEMDTSAD